MSFRRQRADAAIRSRAGEDQALIGGAVPLTGRVFILPGACAMLQAK